MDEEKKTKKGAKTALIIGIAIAVSVVLLIVIALAAGIGYVVVSTNKSNRLQEQLNIAMECQAAGEYNDAIAAYEAAISIDKKCEDAYINLAQIYIDKASDVLVNEEFDMAISFYEQAKDVLSNGYGVIGTEALKARMDDVDTMIDGVEELRNRKVEKCLIKQEVIREDGSLYYFIEYGYDDHGNRVSYKYYNSYDEVQSIFEYEYNEFGEMTRKNHLDNEGNCIEYTEYEYNALGKLKKESDYNASAGYQGGNEYAFDEKGNAVKMYYVSTDGSKTLFCLYEYDDAGNLVKETYYQDKRVSVFYEYEYNADNQVIKRCEYDERDRLADYVKYTYDKAGNKASEYYYDSEGNVMWGDEYEYDGENNKTQNTSVGMNGGGRYTLTYYNYYNSVRVKDNEERESVDPASVASEIIDDIPGENTVKETASQSLEEDEERYREFFENYYDKYSSDLFFDVYNVKAMYAYADLDKDGLDELIIGDKLGAYAVITETNGAYNESKVAGWRLQDGYNNADYYGNGIFEVEVSNGNNYGDEFVVLYVWKYDSSLKNCGLLERLSSCWDTQFPEFNLNNWMLYFAKDENDLSICNIFSDLEGDEKYSFTSIDYGSNYEFDYETGRFIGNEIVEKYYEVIDRHAAGKEPMGFDWMPVVR